VGWDAAADLEPLPWRFPSPPLPSGIVPDDLHRNGYPQLGVVLFRQEALAAVSAYDPGIRYSQDADLLIRIAAQYEIVGVEVVGMLHRLRSPSMARCDYFWAEARREVLQWRPQVAVRWWTGAAFRIRTRGLFYGRFSDDAEACLVLGNRHGALICLWRAARVSPGHALRRFGRLLSLFRRSIGGRQTRQFASGSTSR
jgi:hypothetical protein